MKHHYLTDESREMIALYALGALDQDEAQTFAAHLEEGCSVCAEELQAFAQVACLLGYDAPPMQPRPEVRARLFATLAAETGEANRTRQPQPDADLDLSRFRFIRASERRWRELSPGVSVKILFTDPTTTRSTVLVRMVAGARLAKHRHLAAEELYVLEGDCHVAPGQVLRAGDYFHAEAGSVHEVTFTTEGTTFLSISRNEFLS